MKKIVLACLGIVLGVLSALLLTEFGLSTEAAAALGILIWAVIWWIFKIIPDYVTALIMAVLLICFSKLQPQTVFSAFSTTSWWLLLTAFALSAGVSSSGLLNRVSLHILKLFPGSFKWQTAGMLAVGCVTAPFIPSLSAKATMIAPLSMAVSRSMGYAQGGKEDRGLFLSMIVGIRNPAPLFISGSVLGYALLGFMPENIQERFTMGRWFLAVLPWFLLVSILNYICIVKIYGPKNEIAHSKEGLSEELKELGPMNGKEKAMLGILLVTMLMWVTESVHNIPSYIIAILALSAMHMFNIIDRNSFRSNISWDYLIFMGIVLGISSCFGVLGINEWIISLCGSAIKKLAMIPCLFLLGIGLLTIVSRFVIVSELTFMNIFMVFLVPIAMEAGINPWVAAITVYFFVTPWFFLYQNPVYMAGYYAVGGAMINEREGAKYCFVYMLICAASLIAVLPLWNLAGILYL